MKQRETIEEEEEGRIRSSTESSYLFLVLLLDSYVDNTFVILSNSSVKEKVPWKILHSL